MNPHRGNDSGFSTARGEHPELPASVDEPKGNVGTDGELQLAGGFRHLGQYQRGSRGGAHAILVLHHGAYWTKLVLQLLHHLSFGDHVGLQLGHLR